MSADCFGLPVTTSSDPCIKALDAYFNAVLAYKPFSAWSVSEDAVTADHSCPLARVLAADFAHCSGKGARAEELLRGLQAELDSGIAEERGWTLREQRYVSAWIKWVLEMSPQGCYSDLLGIVQDHPEDLFAVKRGQIMGLILGSGVQILQIVKACTQKIKAPETKQYLHGMWAFGLEQEGHYEDAEAKAREGLEFEATLGSDAWLDHGLAHALYFQGSDRLEDAVEFLEQRCSRWSSEDLHPFLYTHNWWHLSLLYCEQREYDKAEMIFNTHLWAHEDMHADPQVQVNALELLWRFETRGEGSRAHPLWEQVVKACQGSTLPAGESSDCAPSQHSDLLLDILLVRAMAALADGTKLQTWLTAISKHADKLRPSDSKRADAYARIATAVADLYRHDQPEAGMAMREAAARKELRDLKPLWPSIGGSEEQRGILLEAVEGPVVCGEPERNFDKLFF